MDYREYDPCEPLMPYVRCFWTLSSKKGCSSEYTYSIVADGCIDMIFCCHHFEEALITVSGKSADKFLFSGEVSYFGIRFFPAAVHYFFSLSVSGLASQTMEASDLTGKDVKLINEKVFAAASDQARIMLAESWLMQKFSEKNYHPDNRFLQSVYNILLSKGNASINAAVSEYISPRQQRRHFDEYIGLGPKDFSKIIRFQQSINALVKLPPAGRKSVFYEFGYYDQSHFIREFKQLYGDTPKNLFFNNQ